MSVAAIFPKAVLAQVKVIALSALETRPSNRIHLASKAGDARMGRWHQLHLRDQSCPVGLLREIHGDVLPVCANHWKTQVDWFHLSTPVM